MMRAYTFDTFYKNHLTLFVACLTVVLFSCENSTKKTDTEITQQASVGYTTDQQVFCLNMLSNISAHYNGLGSIEDSTAMAINNVLASQNVQNSIGSWKCVWGPNVYVMNDTAVNTMFVAQKNNSDTFVVAIAGTDPVSRFDWKFEDFNVIPTDWDENDKSKGKISWATKTGFSILKEMTANTNDTPTTVQDFLSKSATTIGKLNVWVTGHSLGGALSPAFALYLHDNMDKWTSADVNVNCIAVAGATPGDSTFAAYYDAVMGQTTMRVWNTRDIVPHGYELDMLKEVPDLYGDSVGKIPETVRLALWGLRETLSKTEINYTQLTPSTTYSFTSAIYQKDSLPQISDTLINSFEGQALFHHIPAYGQFFGTLDFQTSVQKTLGLDAPFFTEGAYLMPVYNIKKY